MDNYTYVAKSKSKDEDVVITTIGLYIQMVSHCQNTFLTPTKKNQFDNARLIAIQADFLLLCSK